MEDKIKQAAEEYSNEFWTNYEGCSKTSFFRGAKYALQLQAVQPWFTLEQVTGAVKAKWLKDFGSLNDDLEFAPSGYFMAGFLQAALIDALPNIYNPQSEVQDIDSPLFFLSELVRTVSRVANKFPDSLIELDLDRLTQAQKVLAIHSLRDQNQAPSPTP